MQKILPASWSYLFPVPKWDRDTLFELESATRGVKKNLVAKFYRETSMLGPLFKVLNFIIKRHQHSSFFVNIAKFLRTAILNNLCKRLLLSNMWYVTDND